MGCCSYKIGSIVEISDSINEPYKFITIAKNPSDIYTHTKLVYSEETIILDYEYNEISIDDLDKEIEEKEKTSEYIEEQMNQIINEYEKKALELQKQMLEQMVTLRNSISSKKLTLKKSDN